MRILALYPNAEGYNRIPTGMAIIITILARRGHEVELFDTTFMTATNVEYSIREKAQLVKPTEDCYGYEGLPVTEIAERFLSQLADFRPDALIVSLVEDNYRFADHLLGLAKGFMPELATLVGGPLATVVPDVLLQNPNIDYVVQGEGEKAIESFSEFLEGRMDLGDVPNLWFERNGTACHNSLESFVHMDDVPFQDFSFWDRRHCLKPYDGRIYRTGFIESSRGCPHHCTYCINHAVRACLNPCGRFFRRKSFARVIDEAQYQREQWHVERIVFCDDNFLLCPLEQLAQFAERWRRDMALPYWITTSAEYVNPEKLELLCESGCDGIGLGIEAGSEWFRRNVLRRTVSNEVLIEKFRLIHQFGIRTTANIMIGFPGEHEADMFETIKLMQTLQARSLSMSFVAPYIGTLIHALAAELGLIEVDDTPGFVGMARQLSFLGRPCIPNPYVSDERCMEIYYKAVDYIEGRLPVPDIFLAPAPGATAAAPPRGEMSAREGEIIARLAADMKK